MAKSLKDKIVRVTFESGEVILIGNSYKQWDMQFDEYTWHMHQQGNLTGVTQVEVSGSPWVSWGGLKWCPEREFQKQLNREDCQGSDPDNPNPRVYSKMVFYKEAAVTTKVNKRVRDYLANRY